MSFVILYSVDLAEGVFVILFREAWKKDLETCFTGVHLLWQEYFTGSPVHFLLSPARRLTWPFIPLSVMSPVGSALTKLISQIPPPTINLVVLTPINYP